MTFQYVVNLVSKNIKPEIYVNGVLHKIDPKHIVAEVLTEYAKLVSKKNDPDCVLQNKINIVFDDLCSDLGLSTCVECDDIHRTDDETELNDDGKCVFCATPEDDQ